MRYAARALVRDPRFTIPAILALAISIGANLSVFAVVKAVLMDALPARNAAGRVELRRPRKAAAEEQNGLQHIQVGGGLSVGAEAKRS